MSSHKHKHKHDRMVMVDGVVVVTGLQYVCIFGVYDECSYVCRCLPKRLEACFAVGYANVTRHSMAWHGMTLMLDAKIFKSRKRCVHNTITITIAIVNVTCDCTTIGRNTKRGRISVTV